MRFFALVVFGSIAAAVPAALVPAAGLAERHNDLGAVGGRSPASLGAEHGATIETRALVSTAIDWPSSSYANGNIAYQYQVTSLGSGSYQVAFYNTNPANADVSYVYTAAAIGTGNDGTEVSTTLSSGTSTAYTIQQSGTQLEITIDYA